MEWGCYSNLKSCFSGRIPNGNKFSQRTFGFFTDCFMFEKEVYTFKQLGRDFFQDHVRSLLDKFEYIRCFPCIIWLLYCFFLIQNTPSNHPWQKVIDSRFQWRKSHWTWWTYLPMATTTRNMMSRNIRKLLLIYLSS